MNMPKVSIIIPAYNSMAYLPTTLESVLSQTFTDFEVLIIDDGSSDNIREWVLRIVDPRVKLISQQNQGVSVARNTGIAHARGEYLAFLDGDDSWQPTKLEKQIDYLEANPKVGVVHTWMAVVDLENRPTGRIIASTGEGEIWERIIQGNMVACSSVMVRRCCFEAVGVFDETLLVAEDWDLWIRMAARYPFAVLAEPLVYYRQHPNSKSKNYVARLDDFRRIIEKAFQTVPFEKLYLRSRSYGRVNQVIAWKCLQGKTKEPEKAAYFLRQAYRHYPELRYSKDSIRLSLAIALMNCFGTESYDNLLKLFYSIRQKSLNFLHLISSIARSLKPLRSGKHSSSNLKSENCDYS